MNRSTPTCWILMLVAMLLAGCEVPTNTAHIPATPQAVNPTAERLHDISGSLLLFHGAYKRLPTSLDELCMVTGLDTDRVLDPVSGKPFLYDAHGFARSAATGEIVLLAEPGSPEDPCWSVAVNVEGSAATCRVVPLEHQAWKALTGFREGSKLVPVEPEKPKTPAGKVSP